MRNISFALTTAQFLDGSKTVTRRVGWTNLKIGEKLGAVRKGMGLKPGEKVERLGTIIVRDVRRELLRRMLDDLDYGFGECIREGFPQPSPLCWPSVFVDFFCKTHSGVTPDSTITRIEFEKTPTPDRDG